MHTDWPHLYCIYVDQGLLICHCKVFFFFKGENSAILPSVATLLLLFFAWDTIEHAIATTNDLLGQFLPLNISLSKKLPRKNLPVVS